VGSNETMPGTRVRRPGLSVRPTFGCGLPA